MLIDSLHLLTAARYRLAGFRRHRIDCASASISYHTRPLASSEAPVLFIHGLGTSSSSWVKVLPALRGLRSLYCLDLPGFGSSTYSGKHHLPVLKRLDKALDEFIDAALPLRFTVVGHSLGGWLALRLAIRRPELLDRLIVINPAGVRYPGFEKQADLFRVRSVRDVLRLLETMWYRYPLRYRLLLPSILKELRDRDVPEFIDSVTASDFINDALPALRIPTDIVWGVSDGLIEEQALHILQQTIPSSRTYLINRCGHIPQLERPRDLISVLSILLESSHGLGS